MNMLIQSPLQKGEHFFLTVYDQFAFLRQNGYEKGSFKLVGKEFWVSFYHTKRKRKITILFREDKTVDCVIESTRFFLKKKILLSQYLGYRFRIQSIDVLRSLIIANHRLCEELLVRIHEEKRNTETI